MAVEHVVDAGVGVAPAPARRASRPASRSGFAFLSQPAPPQGVEAGLKRLIDLAIGGALGPAVRPARPAVAPVLPPQSPPPALPPPTPPPPPPPPLSTPHLPPLPRR